MEGNRQQKFIDKLEEKYGAWDRLTSRFGRTAFGTIAQDLSISGSQFTKLISGTATEGMYIRTIENINRLMRMDAIVSERDDLRLTADALQRQVEAIKGGRRNLTLKYLAGAVTIMAVSAVAVYFLQSDPSSSTTETASNHPLSAFFDKEFDAAYDAPYLKESEVQDYCPGSAFEGTWVLDHQYTVPLPGTRRPGVYYTAKSADVRIKCSRSDTLNPGKGRVLWAYEYLINEIWVDVKSTPLSPKYFDKDKKAFTPEFESLDFENNQQFRRVATIHSFFFDKFEIYDDSIVRNGEPCGRYATNVDQALASEYQIDPKHILENVVGDLTQTACASVPNLYCDPNDLEEGKSVISFECLYTIRSENLGIGGGYPYTKGYRLVSQNYADNLTCSCKDTTVN